MPHGDRTGPMGQGSRTGRGAGFCNSYIMPGYADRGVNYPVGGPRNMSAGGGGGHRHWYFATGLPGWKRGEKRFLWSHWGDRTVPPAITRSQELEMLNEEAGYFEDALNEIKHRISKLESRPDSDENLTGG